MSIPAAPLVSVLMVARNAAAHIDAALASARKQTCSAIEIVVVDDQSTDATLQIIRRHAAQDPRIVAVRGHGRGLAAVRNLSITAAAAPFAVVLDSDDMIHPRHVEHLLDLIRRSGADLAAANMIAFSRTAPPTLFASGEPWQRERRIGHEEYWRAGRLNAQEVSLGYLKPIFRLDALRRVGLTYDARLRIGEDWDLAERALAAGLTFAYRPEPTYFYRRHAGSTSFRWRREDLAGLIAAEGDRPAGRESLAQAQRARLGSLRDALAHCEAVSHLKAWQPGRALVHLLRRPRAAGLLWASAREGLSQRAATAFARRQRGTAAPDDPQFAILCGDPAPGSAVAVAAALLAASGCAVRQMTQAELADPLCAARAGHNAAMVLLADVAIADLAAFLIADGAPFVAAGAACHPLIDHRIDRHSTGDLLSLLPIGALADGGLPWRERSGLAQGFAA